MPDHERTSAVPKDFFTAQTFGTLGGCVIAAGVTATVISGVFKFDPKIVGLIVSMIVAYVALFMAKKKRRADYVIAAFNGFLIYFTLVGATSFYPYLNKGTAADVISGNTNAPAPIFSPWVRDPNLVQAGRVLTDINQEQAKTLNSVQSNATALEQKVERLNISPAASAEITAGLAANQHLIMMTRTNVATRVKALKPLRVRQ